MSRFGRTAAHIGTTYNIQQSRIHRPANKATHSTTQNSGVAGRGGARGGEYGLRNYECFPSSHLPHAEMLHPGRENTCYMQNAPSRKGKHLPHAKMLPPLERDSLPIDFMLE